MPLPHAAPLRILDPACGSGSFLLGAYQCLLDYHLNWYVEHPTRQPRKEIYQGAGGRWFLTTEEKKRILLNHIYGVDIDPQAVEVTKLSLLLKVLEDESAPQLALMPQRALPDLADNIKCGNSLIGPDFYDGQQTMMLDDDEMYRINVFDWQSEFPEIMGAGGFDVVIGNPPYVRQEMLGDLKAYFQEHYQVYHGVADLYAYFIERGVSLLKPGGLFSYIVANKWMRANYGKPLRRWLKARHIEEIVDFGDLPVFKKATTYPCLLRIRQGAPDSHFQVAQMDTLEFTDLDDYVHQRLYRVNQANLDEGGWSLMDERTEALLAKLRSSGVPLGEYVGGAIYRGVLTGLNKAFVIDAETRDRLIAEDPKSAELIKPFLAGRDVKRYRPLVPERYLIFTRRGINIKEYPAVERHLLGFKERLMSKPKGWRGNRWPGRKPGPYKWYEIQDTIAYYEEFEKPKIIYPDIAVTNQFTYTRDDMYMVNTLYFLPVGDLFLLGVLNSAVIEFILQSVSPPVRGGYYRYFSQYISQFPIRIIDFSDPADVARHDRLVALVERMLALHKQLEAAKTPTAKTMLQRQIDATDRQIDRLVYELYDLTEEEIAIVEAR